MSCPTCGSPAVGFSVPESIREYAPAERSAICSRCLRTFPASDVHESLRLSCANQTQSDDADVDAPTPDEIEFTTIHESFPGGRGGVAFALALGHLDSLALNREAIEALCAAAERAGTDVPLALERLAGAETLDPPFDVGRRAEQLESLR